MSLLLSLQSVSSQLKKAVLCRNDEVRTTNEGSQGSTDSNAIVDQRKSSTLFHLWLRQAFKMKMKLGESAMSRIRFQRLEMNHSKRRLKPTLWNEYDVEASKLNVTKWTKGRNKAPALDMTEGRSDIMSWQLPRFPRNAAQKTSRSFVNSRSAGSR